MKAGEHQDDPNKTRPLHLRTRGTVNSDGEENRREKSVWKEFNFWLVLFTGIYSLVSFGLFCQTKKSADAAALSAKTARDAFVLSQLADIEPKGVTCEKDNASADELFSVHFQNLGRTRAVNIKPIWRMRIGGHDCALRPQPDYRSEMLSGDSDESGAVGIQKCISAYAFKGEDLTARMAQIHSGALTFEIVGNFAYDDALGGQHIKTFIYSSPTGSDPTTCGKFDYYPDVQN